ncbi:MAG: hypothetical protein ACFFCX_16085 [Candidatus Sifarchaeia archaeon]
MQANFSVVLEDIIVYFIGLIYAAMILVIADLVRKKRNLGSEVTRNIVHIFAGAVTLLRALLENRQILFHFR